MTDPIYNSLMVLFFFLMWVVVLHPRVPTGFWGSLGCITVSLAAIFSIDNSLLKSVESIETTIFMLCFGVGMVTLHVFIRLHKTNRAPKNQHRRRKDWDLEEAGTR